MSDILEKLDEYFKTSSPEKIAEDWKKYNILENNIGPTVEELIQANELQINPKVAKLQEVISKLNYLKSGIDVCKERVRISLRFENNLKVLITAHLDLVDSDLYTMTMFKNNDMVYAGAVEVENIISKFYKYK